jgi:hypothetical protein
MATRKKPVLVFTDTHAPYHHEDALDFLFDTYMKWGCGSSVHAGDLWDFHYQSRFATECDALNPREERRLGLVFNKKMCKMFPKGVLVPGNHDMIPARQMAAIGLDPDLLKCPEDLYGFSNGWKVSPLYHTIFDGKVLIEHGIGSGGIYGAINTAIAKRTSFVQGHIHAHAMVKYVQNYQDKIFGMNAGWLGDESSLATRYGRHNKYKGVLGCGVVFGPEEAYFVPMAA